MRYTSFKATDSNVHLGILHSNNLVNIDVKYEVLENINVHDVVIEQGKNRWLQEYLLNIKFKGNRLFATVEKGRGKYSNNVIVIVSPKAKLLACKWIAQYYGKSIKIERKVNYKISFLLYQEKEETQNYVDLKKFTKQTVEMPGALKKNNFEKKYKDYTNIQKNNENELKV